MKPKPRADCSLVEREHNLYIFGGKDLNETFNDFWEFDLEEKRFRKLHSPS